MKKVIALALVAVMALVMIASCGGGDKALEGKWEAAEGIVSFEFKSSDVTMTISGASFTGTWSTSGSDLKIKIEGDEQSFPYKVEGDTLTITMNGADVILNRVN